MNLFEQNTKKPLADRLRPKDLKDIVGQTHLVGEEGFLRSLVVSGNPTSIILWVLLVPAKPLLPELLLRAEISLSMKYRP